MSEQPASERVARRFEDADDPHPDPPDPPEGWQGGAAEDTDAGVVGRQWVEPDLGVRVSYNLEDLKVTAERVEWDESRELWRFTGLVAADRYETYDSDEEAMAAALTLLEEFTNGEIEV